MGSPPLAGVLWDMDGTLIDTEPLWFRAERSLVREHGSGEWSTDNAQEMIGFDLIDAARHLQHHAGVALGDVEIVEWLLDSVIAQLDERPPWQPGARELLRALNDAQVPCALVTMSWRPLADTVLAHLPDSFAATITGDEVPAGRGKPDPTPYLMGAEAIGAAASDCVAIEDSATGATSAQRAGCQVLAIPNRWVTPSSVGGLFPDSVTVESSLEGVSLARLGELVGVRS